MKALKNSLLLNASMVTSFPTGVGIYSLLLIKHLVPLLSSNKISFTIYTYNKSAFAANINVKTISLGALIDHLLKKKITLHRHLWNIVYVGFLAKRYSMIFSPSSHGTLFHKNQIITIHDLISLAYPQQHKSQYFYFKKYIPLLTKRSKHIVTISKFTKAEVIRYYNVDNAKITTIYNGIDHFENVVVTDDEIEWVHSITGNKPFCIVVGASYFHKNADTVLKVATLMQHKEFVFVLVGTHNHYFSQLQERANSLKLRNIKFLQYLNKKKLAALYKLARVNLYISLYEGFGFPPAEALSFGTKSLLSTQPALIEVYENFAEFVDPFNTNEIAEKISKCLMQKKEVSNDFSMLRQKFNWDKSALLTMQLIQQYL